MSQASEDVPSRRNRSPARPMTAMFSSLTAARPSSARRSAPPARRCPSRPADERPWRNAKVSPDSDGGELLGQRRREARLRSLCVRQSICRWAAMWDPRWLQPCRPLLSPTPASSAGLTLRQSRDQLSHPVLSEGLTIRPLQQFVSGEIDGHTKATRTGAPSATQKMIRNMSRRLSGRIVHGVSLTLSRFMMVSPVGKFGSRTHSLQHRGRGCGGPASAGTAGAGVRQRNGARAQAVVSRSGGFLAFAGTPPHVIAYRTDPHSDPAAIGFAFWTTDPFHERATRSDPQPWSAGFSLAWWSTRHGALRVFLGEPPRFAAQFKGKSVRDGSERGAISAPR